MEGHAPWEVLFVRDGSRELKTNLDEEEVHTLARLTQLDELVWWRVFQDIMSSPPYIFALRITLFRNEMTIAGNVSNRGDRDHLINLFHRALRSSGPAPVKLTDHIQVTAPFRPAHRSDLEQYVARSDSSSLAMDSALETSPPASVDVDRYPSITAEKPPVVGEIFRFQVALDAEPTDASAEPVSFKKVPGDWRVLRVAVEVHSSRLRFKDGDNRKTINVVRQGRTLPVSFSATVLDDGGAGSPLEIVAIFTYEYRFSGMIRQTFEVERSTGSPGSTFATAVNMHSASVADLTIKIFRSDTLGNYIWSFDAPRGRNLGSPERSEFVNLGTSTGDYAMGLLRECPGFAAGQHAGKLRGIGEEIWKISPPSFKLLYRDMHREFGPSFPIQIITDEPHIAWEMMHPDNDAGVNGPDHLFMTHPIARWLVHLQGRISSKFTPGSIASFVPNYKDEESLAMALEEGQWLADNLGAVAQEATYKGFTDFWGSAMPREPVAVLHFAGHGDTDAAGIAKIKLVDGWVSCNDVHGGVRLGREHGTFVVLNACKVGASEYRLGLSSGWAASLTGQGFRGVLAPLWAVQDKCASVIVRDYLTSFMQGVPLGEAMQTARAASRHLSSTPYAYVVHGDVMARIEPETSA
ncbi:CHAT domain-containing protein [Rhodopseudomonas boonkerdii]|uniref:CHAT domain-containing protein n=1 Tax=Rhodopseudomonas boonkerdii TaxID=475937 RepID=UPI001E5E3E4A|nr:CHAT domain-containing protein [Rhodopseudomonas boonkerdii]UGV26932.1 CHAT domain-containing protein [Rhodopseudomonas boonkerdii]